MSEIPWSNSLSWIRNFSLLRVLEDLLDLRWCWILYRILMNKCVGFHPMWLGRGYWCSLAETRWRWNILSLIDVWREASKLLLMRVLLLLFPLNQHCHLSDSLDEKWMQRVGANIIGVKFFEVLVDRVNRSYSKFFNELVFEFLHLYINLLLLLLQLPSHQIN